VTRIRTVAILLAASSTLHAIPAIAQAGPSRSRVEIGVGVLWAGSIPLGTKAATETTASGGTSALFSTTSELAGVAGVEGRIGVRVTESIVVEGQVSYLAPELRVAVSADAEGAAAVTAVDVTQQFTIGGRALWYVPGRRWSPRFAPFAMAGGGYLRQLHEQATLLQTGRFYQIGGGVSALLVSRPHFHTKGAGVRFDVSALVRSGGVAFDGGSQTSPAAGASAFVRF
jgi:hypothetical protein